MASTLFTNATATVPGTLVVAPWLNETDKATHNYLSAVAGTNTITATGPVSSVGYVAGDRYFFVPANANSGAVTININGLGAKNVTKYGVTALVANDLITGEVFQAVYDGVQFQLMNPKTVDVAATGRLVGIQTFTAAGTYTPTAGTTSIKVRLQGGGGGGGGSPATGAGQLSAGAGGGAGAYCEGRITSGFSGQSVVIGLGGGGGVGVTGAAGTASTFMTLSAGGGGGGVATVAAAQIAAVGGAGGTASGGYLNARGRSAASIALATATVIFTSGQGAASSYGDGGINQQTIAGVANGANAAGFGSGGGGSLDAPSQPTGTGGGGTPGFVIIEEYS